MKKTIKQSLVLLVLVVLFMGQTGTFLPTGFQGPPPPPNLPPDWTHINECWGNGAGTVSVWWTFFNDPDGDCISNQHCTFYWGLDGTWHRTNGKVDGWQLSRGGETPVNFNRFNCCPPRDLVSGTGTDPNVSGTGGTPPNCFLQPDCEGCADLVGWARCVIFCEYCSDGEGGD